MATPPTNAPGSNMNDPAPLAPPAPSPTWAPPPSQDGSPDWVPTPYQTAPLSGRLPGSERRPLPGAVAKGAANPHAVIEVTLKLRRKAALPPLEGRPAEPMTREALAAGYGADPSDLDSVEKAFARFNLKTIRSDATTRTLVLSGRTDDMERAFRVKLMNYAQASGDYRGRVGGVHLPADVDGKVVGVFGLDNRQAAHRKRRHPGHAPAGVSPTRVAAARSAWLIPSQLAERYKFPPGDGSGETLGILEFGGGYFPDDLAAFCKQADVPAPMVKAVSVDGTPTNARDGAEGEVMLDVEVAAGVCPQAKIVLYFASFTEQGWIQALDAAIHDAANSPQVLSISWGYAEDAYIWTGQAMAETNETLKEAALLGITVCVAAGDDGSSDGVTQDGHAHTDFPASCPYTLAVGGTTVPALNAPADIGWKEGDGLRNDNGGSTGGGVSAVFARPSWQNGVGVASVNPGAGPGRCVPDIAANADWNASPYLLVVDGQSQPNGGTSAATPLIASLITLINAQRKTSGKSGPVGYLTPLLYQNSPDGGPLGASCCTDVVTGDNITAAVGGYRAMKGYDAVTGWGTPNGVALSAAIP